MNRTDQEVVVETDPGLVPLAGSAGPSLPPAFIPLAGAISSIAGLLGPNILLTAAANSVGIAAGGSTITFSLASTAATTIFNATTELQVNSTAVVRLRKTGWGSPSGTLSRAAYAAYAGQTVSNPPTQAEMQALDNAVKLLSETVAALLTDLHATTSGATGHALIGA